jgi:predicted Fe-Mo cluster-binding NifX family protein
MKICVTSVSGNLDAQVDQRFGRCQYFMIVESDSMQFETVPNLAVTSGSGAGIQAAQTIASKKVQVLITGNVGPKAFQALSAAGITIIASASGKVRAVIEKYKKGLFSETKAPTVGGHFGMRTGKGQDKRIE